MPAVSAANGYCLIAEIKYCFSIYSFTAPTANTNKMRCRVLFQPYYENTVQLNGQNQIISLEIENGRNRAFMKELTKVVLQVTTTTTTTTVRKHHNTPISQVR